MHESVGVDSGKAAVERPEFRWANTILGNIKGVLRTPPMSKRLLKLRLA
ncbi:MAG: hypothetical protein OXU81_11135 [Gammaproteobacteria bacterium]|nr:hypothetical protein [Gammaproteobacteria bacterium]